MLKEWLLGMLANRGCSRPGGRWLYAYRLLSSEYDSWRECLCEATRTTGVSPLARRNKYFAPLFVCVFRSNLPSIPVEGRPPVRFQTLPSLLLETQPGSPVQSWPRITVLTST